MANLNILGGRQWLQIQLGDYNSPILLNLLLGLTQLKVKKDIDIVESGKVKDR